MEKYHLMVAGDFDLVVPKDIFETCVNEISKTFEIYKRRKNGSITEYTYIYDDLSLPLSIIKVQFIGWVEK